jgi:hypothetical protein
MDAETDYAAGLKFLKVPCMIKRENPTAADRFRHMGKRTGCGFTGRDNSKIL